MSTPIVSSPESIKMARSPIFFTGKNNTTQDDSLDYMSLAVKAWSGAKTAAPTTPLLSMEKAYSVNEVINFEVSELVRSEFNHDFGVYTTNGFADSPTGEILWLSGRGSYTYSDNGAVPDMGLWSSTPALCADGWSAKTSPENGAIGSSVLTDERVFYVAESTYGALPIYNNGIDHITIEWKDGESGMFGTLPAYDDTTQKAVIYAGVYPANLEDNESLELNLKPSTHGCEEWYDVVLRDELGGEIQRVRFQMVNEIKYNPIQVGWVNKYGVFDTMVFFKVSTEQGNFTSESYQRSIYADGFTTPALDKGQFVDFNVNSRNTITLNSGWVDEEYKNIVQDILMSESVAVLITQATAATIWNDISILWEKWASYWNNGIIANAYWIAANPNRGSMDYIKEVNQALINYTLPFTFAFNERTMLR